MEDGIGTGTIVGTETTDMAERPVISPESVTIVTDGAEPVGSVVGGTMMEDSSLGNPGRLRLKSSAGSLVSEKGNPSLGRSVSRCRASSGRGYTPKASAAGRK